jgi:hypothetical protein
MAHDVQERIVEVKRELKKFENGFKARHGRHPTRDEVKSDAKIRTIEQDFLGGEFSLLIQAQTVCIANTKVSKDSHSGRNRTQSKTMAQH